MILQRHTTEPTISKYGKEQIIKGNGFEVCAFFSQYNDRIRVISYQTTNFPNMVTELVKQAEGHSLKKIFVKAHSKDAEELASHGFVEEAIIQGYYQGNNAAIMSYFMDAQRATPFVSISRREETLRIATQPPSTLKQPLESAFSVRAALPEDAPMLSALFSQNFDSYPFPVSDPGYIRETMNNGVYYQVILKNEAIIAVASAETQAHLKNAEMTDFATSPIFRGKGLARHLLASLEIAMHKQGISNLYTLARTASVSINRVFGNLGYTYTGTLIKNCHISGNLEDMNCWCKQLR